MATLFGQPVDIGSDKHSIVDDFMYGSNVASSHVYVRLGISVIMAILTIVRTGCYIFAAVSSFFFWCWTDATRLSHMLGSECYLRNWVNFGAPHPKFGAQHMKMWTQFWTTSRLDSE